MRVFILIFALALTYTSSTISGQPSNMKTISKKGMTVKYVRYKSKLSFEISAPTIGWVAIGFNEQSKIKGTHLVMCHIVNGNADIVEHYTIDPGNYMSIIELGGKSAISNIQGSQRKNNTTISFDIKVIPVDHYHKDLSPNREYYITLAYSLSDDFQHHSIMRTNIKSKL